MRTPHLTAALLAASLLVAGAAGVAHSHPTTTDPAPVTAVNTATAAELDAYWTPERIAAATEMPLPDPAADLPGTNTAHGDPVSFDGAPAAEPHTQGLAENEGRLLFSMPDGDYICSGTVVSADNRLLVATARHCGFGNGGTNYRFAPNYSAGATPFGWWDWASATWLPGEGITDDWAFLKFSPKDGRTLTDVVGSSGIGFNQGLDHYAHIYGIPGDTDVLTHCEGQAYGGPDGQPLMDNCNGMSGGASGGAWVVNLQPDGTGMQVGTYFGSYGAAATGSYLGDVALEAYRGIQG